MLTVKVLLRKVAVVRLSSLKVLLQKAKQLLLIGFN